MKKKYLSMLMWAAVIQTIGFCSIASAEDDHGQSTTVTFTIHNDSRFTLNYGGYNFVSYPEYKEDVPDLDKPRGTKLAPGDKVDFDIDMSKPRIHSRTQSLQYNGLIFGYYYAPSTNSLSWSYCELDIRFNSAYPTGYELTKLSEGRPGYITCEAEEGNNGHDLYIKNAS